MALVFLKYSKERKEKLERAESILREKLRKIGEILPDAKVYLFGSLVEGTFDILSDIDVVIVSNNIENKLKVVIEIQKILGVPFEIHLFSEEEWKSYKKYIKYKEIG